jgi:hypothetical protein
MSLNSAIEVSATLTEPESAVGYSQGLMLTSAGLRSAADRICQQIAAAMSGQQEAEVVELKKSPA